MNNEWKRKRLGKSSTHKRRKPLYNVKAINDSMKAHDCDEVQINRVKYDTTIYGLNRSVATVLSVLYNIEGLDDCMDDNDQGEDATKTKSRDEEEIDEGQEGGHECEYSLHEEEENEIEETDARQEDQDDHECEYLPDVVDGSDSNPHSDDDEDGTYLPPIVDDDDDDDHEDEGEGGSEDDDDDDVDDGTYEPSLDFNSDDEDCEGRAPCLSDRYENCTMDGFTDGNEFGEAECEVGNTFGADATQHEIVAPDLQRKSEQFQQRITKALNKEGLSQYLESRLAGSISAENSKAVIVKVVRFLLWTFFCGYSRGKSSKAFAWFKTMIIHKYAKIGEYCTYMENVKEFEPATIKNNLGALSKCAKWAILFSNNVDPTTAPAHLTGFMEVINTFQKAYSRANRSKRSSKTMESEVYLGKMPAGGLPELQETFVAEITWVQKFVQLAKAYEATHRGRPYSLMTNADYSRFSSAMYAGLYTFAPNGRVGGIEDLKEMQYDQLVEEGHVHSKKFKTNVRYGYQPVILSTISYFFVKIFWEHFRPVAMNNLRTALGDDMPDKSVRSLWVNFDGKPERIGPRVTQYFKRTLGIHITTTAMRSLVETTTETLARAGDITKSQREAVHNINGHTSQVTNDYYLKMDRNADVCRGREAFDIVMPSTASIRSVMHSPSSPANEDVMRLERPDTWTGHTKDILRVAEWGTGHPDYEKSTQKEKSPLKRATWTKKEVAYIADYCNQKIKMNPDAKSTIVASCFQHIQRDPEAIPIFHRIHVVDSGRVRSGYRIAMKAGLIFEN